jgi:hypothetical protein
MSLIQNFIKLSSTTLIFSTVRYSYVQLLQPRTFNSKEMPGENQRTKA